MSGTIPLSALNQFHETSHTPRVCQETKLAYSVKYLGHSVDLTIIDFMLAHNFGRRFLQNVVACVRICGTACGKRLLKISDKFLALVVCFRKFSIFVVVIYV